MLAVGKPDSSVGWMLVAREVTLLAAELARTPAGEVDRAQRIESASGAEAQIEESLEPERPQSREDPRRRNAGPHAHLGAAAAPRRTPAREGAGETDEVNRRINPPRGRRRPRGR